MERIEQMLWNKTTEELKRLCVIAKVKGSNGNKETKVQKLYEFYNNENWQKIHMKAFQVAIKRL